MGDNRYSFDERRGLATSYSSEDKRQQKQIKVNKQLLKQKLSQEYTNDMLGRALSKAEYISSRFGKFDLLNKQFNYYNRFDNGINKDKANLVKSFINSLDTLQDYYEIDGKAKIFPSNMKQNDLIKYIENLRDNLNIDVADANKKKVKNGQENDSKEDLDEIIVKLFNDFIHIIKGGSPIIFDDYFNTKIASADPNKLAHSGIDAMKFAAKQEAEWVKKIEEKGDYDINLEIGKDWKSNPNISDHMIFGDIKNFK